MTYMDLKGQKLKSAEKQISVASTEDKNFALKCVAEAINSNRKEILAANEKDVQNGILSNMSEGLVDRLKLDDSRIDGIIDGINTVIKLQDPVWKSDRVWTMENGLTFSKMTVPIGVIGIIYESRPNVTVDAFALAIKSGNCILLRGSSLAINSNLALVDAIKQGLRNSNITEEVIGFVEDTDRDLVSDMLNATDYLDLIIP